MGKLKPKYTRPDSSECIEEVFLMEALGRLSACDVRTSASKKPVLAKGTVICPRTIGDLAATGIDRVPVYRRPKISIIVVGNGLIPPGVLPVPGKTYDSNTPMLRAALESMHIRPIFVRQLTNRPIMLKRVIPFALNQSDIMILMVEKSQYQHGWIKNLVSKTNARTVFSAEGRSVARQAKQQGQKIVFCLPYDSNLIFDYFYKHIQPAIQSFAGYANAVPAKNIPQMAS